MMDELEKKVKSFASKHGIFEPNDKILIGISGGADSVCLFFVLLSLREEMHLSLRCVHVNHGIRGDAADADAAFSVHLAERFQVPIDVVKCDIPYIAKKEGLSEEEAGRLERRRIFEEMMCKYHLNKVALAHHADDQAETLVMNICRGTTLKGLAGIEPLNGPYIRPLLNLRRTEIEAYLEKKREPYVTDETNFCDDYTRNVIRHKVMPVLQESVNAKAVEHMGEMALYMGRVKAYFLNEAARLEERAVERGGNRLVLNLNVLNGVPGIIKGEVFFRFLRRMVPVNKIEAVHIEALQNLAEGECGRRFFLPENVRAEKAENRLFLYKERKWETESSEIVLKPGEWVKWGAYEIKFELECNYSSQIPKEEEWTYTKRFDCDIIESDLVVRSRLPGDYIIINCDGKRQKIKKTFINEKVPQSDRNSVPLIASGSRVFWAVGVKCGVEAIEEGKPFIKVTARKEDKEKWKKLKN